MTRKIFLTVIYASMLTHLFAQQKEPLECGVNMRKNAKSGVDLGLKQQRINALGLQASLPYTMRIQVVVFYKNTPTVSDADIHRNINAMADFFRPYNICFIMSDIEYVRDSTLAEFNTGNEDLLLSYTRPSYLSIFVHTSLRDSFGALSGYAYSIPNAYLSMLGGALLDSNRISILAHEMGHCFGLYHTFENQFGYENRARTGTCKNCETKGDYLCDTEADLNISETQIGTDCVYTGTATSLCDNSRFVMETRNIMSYGRWACHDRFTNGQGGRARDHILTETMLFNCIAPDVLTLSTTTNYTGGVYSITAKEWINVTSPSYNISGSAQMRMTSRTIRLGPGVSLRPTGFGAIVALKTNTYCE
ncbi:MAG: hypothetical protein H7X88_10150 [Gloeobacteraceae cyanobacterium ES-bin-316]|nr:hypothetical protein [Ferruginibacter sp.]